MTSELVYTSETTINNDAVKTLQSRFERKKTSVGIPDFNFTSGTMSAQHQLIGMGMRSAFTDKADFSEIAPTAQLKIGDVFHEVRIAVDEKGTTAAAGTAVIPSLGASDGYFFADHPFVFLIRDNPTGKKAINYFNHGAAHFEMLKGALCYEHKEYSMNSEQPSSDSQLLIYQTPSGDIKLEVRLENETVWLTQDHMAELFGKSKSTINEHIKNIFAESELVENAVMKKFGISEFQQKTPNFYNIDYDPADEKTIEFFKIVQNKLLWAISKQTAAELVYRGCYTSPFRHAII